MNGHKEMNGSLGAKRDSPASRHLQTGCFYISVRSQINIPAENVFDIYSGLVSVFGDERQEMKTFFLFFF